ncbi:TauD/TfdA family dioxygenase [Streptomyces tricolor]|uniref:TauD/TfdA family dioxygenase n=1 Tax=Streptomyces tricolor TaxID=68277 RepID=A0ABS9JFP4_9ACTN|nr:TauD/TfdA family dioxygenase [Streptomyces tricolor]MCG0064373.1 TauD/TfdA family dioxygenase [Streptomyces tricolor]
MTAPHPAAGRLASGPDRLEQDGYVVVERLGGQRHAIELLQRIGRFLPQYTGTVEHEVVHRPGHEGRAYSQSRNTIQAHTEAPGWDPSPRYLALYCHRQARCGGGHTDLLDLHTLLKLLGAEDRALLTGTAVAFPGPDADREGHRPVTVPMLSYDGKRPVLRFSYNLLTAADYDAPLDAAPPPEHLPLGQRGIDLAHRVGELFARHRTRVLVPDGALLIWDNQRMLHARSQYADERRHLTRYWIAA